MKTRNGFVSNSSSSSFIIFSKNKIETIEDVKKNILKTNKEILATFVDYNETTVIKTDDASSYVKPSVELEKSELKQRLHQYIFDKFDVNYHDMTIDMRKHFSGYNKGGFRYVGEAPVQNILGYKIDFRKIIDKYNTLMEQFSGESWKKYHTLSRWVTRKDVNALYNTIMKKYPNTFKTEIGDDSNVGRFLEHNYEWKVKYLKISNH